jgi:hypothetical protein
MSLHPTRWLISLLIRCRLRLRLTNLVEILRGMIIVLLKSPELIQLMTKCARSTSTVMLVVFVITVWRSGRMVINVRALCNYM